MQQHISSLIKRLINVEAKPKDGPDALIWLSLWSLVPGQTSQETTEYVAARIVPNLLSPNEQEVSYLSLTNTNPAARGSGRYTCFKAPNDDPANLLLIRAPRAAIGELVTTIKSLPLCPDTTAQSTEALYGANLRHYELVQTVQSKLPSRQAHCILTVSIEPADRKDLDRWYREEHYALLAAVPLFVRSRRYVPVSDNDQTTPWSLAVHEFESVEGLVDLSFEKGAVVPKTEWGRRVLGGARRVERTVWKVGGS